MSSEPLVIFKRRKRAFLLILWWVWLLAFRFKGSRETAKPEFFSEALVAVKKSKPKFCLWAETSQSTSGDWAESELWRSPGTLAPNYGGGNNLGGVFRL